MKRISILTAMLLAVAGLGFAGCQENQRDAREPGVGTEQPLGTQPAEPGADERTGFEENQDNQILEDERQQGSDALDETQQEWNQNVEEPVQREIND